MAIFAALLTAGSSSLFLGAARRAASSAFGGGVAGRLAGRAVAQSVRGAIRGTGRIQEIDRGWRNINRQLKRLDGMVSIIGLPRTGTTSGRHTMSELIRIAATHEFGGGNNIPSRSFMRSAVDEKRNAIKRLQLQAVFRITGNRSTADRELFKLGQGMQLFIQQKIQTGPFTPLKPATIRKKGHAIPLIETKQLLNSIQHKETTFAKLL